MVAAEIFKTSSDLAFLVYIENLNFYFYECYIHSYQEVEIISYEKTVEIRNLNSIEERPELEPGFSFIYSPSKEDLRFYTGEIIVIQGETFEMLEEASQFCFNYLDQNGLL